MIDLGDPLHSADTAFLRAGPEDVFEAICDPFAYAAFWAGARTVEHKVTTGPTGAAALAIGDRWRLRLLLGRSGADCEVVVTDLRVGDDRRNLWMDWRGDLDPVVGLPLRRRDLEAETEYFVRGWRSGTLVTQFWRVRSVPKRQQQRLLLDLRRAAWRMVHGLKLELEGAP